MSQSLDPVRDLNNYLQCYRIDLAPLLSWELRQEGPNHHATHSATIKLRGNGIGHGKGTNRSIAKKEAAIQALAYLKAEEI